MLWIIPIAGNGTRTKSLGEFKPFIEIKGQAILSWVILSLNSHVLPEDTFIFITTNYFYQKFNVGQKIQGIFNLHGLSNQFHVITSPSTPPGPMASIYLAKESLETNNPVSIVNGDQYIDFQLPLTLLPKSAYLTVFADFTNDFGYVQVQNGLISRFVTKQNISNLASAGVYIFPEGKSLIKVAQKLFKDKIVINGEYRLETAFNYLIEKGWKLHPISIFAHYALGDPKSIHYFSNSPLADSLSKTMIGKKNDGF